MDLSKPNPTHALLWRYDRTAKASWCNGSTPVRTVPYLSFGVGPHGLAGIRVRLPGSQVSFSIDYYLMDSFYPNLFCNEKGEYHSCLAGALYLLVESQCTFGRFSKSYHHNRSTLQKPKIKRRVFWAASISLAYLPQIKPCLRRFIGGLVALQLSQYEDPGPVYHPGSRLSTILSSRYHRGVNSVTAW